MLGSRCQPSNCSCAAVRLQAAAPESATNVDRGYVDVAWVDSTGTGYKAQPNGTYFDEAGNRGRAVRVQSRAPAGGCN